MRSDNQRYEYELRNLKLLFDEVGEERSQDESARPRSRTAQRPLRALPLRGAPKPIVTSNRMVAEW